MGPGPCSPRSLPMNFIEWAVVGVCRVLLWISTSVIFIILVANTVLRYATGTSLQWANEVPELLFPWLVMSGVVLAAAHGAHITTSFLMDALSPWLRRRASLGRRRAGGGGVGGAPPGGSPVPPILRPPCPRRTGKPRHPRQGSHHERPHSFRLSRCGRAGHAHRPCAAGRGHGRSRHLRPRAA